jgi:mannose-6-phosphate isomerase-like protein (cupin superfamily)
MKFAIWRSNNILHQLSLLHSDEERYVECGHHGSMTLGMYAPYKQDMQETHDQDELYFVLSGSGTFVNGNDIYSFKPGDAMFVAAGVNHRFENFTDDFSAWVVFWGKTGGEHDQAGCTQ